MCDGALEAKDSALVLDHLKSCNDCQREWTELEELRSRFQEAKAMPGVPSGLMDRISDRLRKEEQSHIPRISTIYALPTMTVVAGVLVLGLLLLPSILHRGAPQPALADSLIDQLSSSEGFQTVADRNELSKKIGYDLKYLNLSNWRMQQASIYTTPNRQAIARFDFVRNGEHLSCYQGVQGSIQAPNSAREDVADKQVAFGNHDNLHYALWSQNGRDYLFITPLPVEQLKEIVRES
jgi:hypothetical protein